MIRLDTHAWFWWEDEPQHLSGTASDTIDTEDVVAVSPISAWELAMLVSKSRISLQLPVLEWARQSCDLSGLRVLPASLAIASLAGGDTLDLHGDPADRMLAATAIIYDVPLVTRDRRLHECTQVNTLW